MSVEVDVVTKGGGLLHGTVDTFTLDKSDDLATLSLSEAMELVPGNETSEDIMMLGDRVTVMASDISRISVRYIPLKQPIISKELSDALRKVGGSSAGQSEQ